MNTKALLTILGSTLLFILKGCATITQETSGKDLEDFVLKTRSVETADTAMHHEHPLYIASWLEHAVTSSTHMRDFYKAFPDIKKPHQEVYREGIRAFGWGYSTTSSQELDLGIWKRRGIGVFEMYVVVYTDQHTGTIIHYYTRINEPPRRHAWAITTEPIVRLGVTALTLYALDQIIQDNLDRAVDNLDAKHEENLHEFRNESIQEGVNYWEEFKNEFGPTIDEFKNNQ